jgi:Amt family ammonium transporter
MGATGSRTAGGRTFASKALALIGVVLACTAPAFAQETATPEVNSGDTAWILTSTALVMLMTAPGLALFYGGLVSYRNAVSTVMHSFILLCVISLQWVLIGYSIAFGTDIFGLIGGSDYLGFAGVGPTPNGTSTVPHIAFAMYQCVFAIITVALISGAVAERMRFSSFLLFGVLWATFIYDPLAHWVWGGGWLMTLGALDFAGGTVVHVSSGVSALVAAVVIGKRKGFPTSVSAPHNLLLTIVGAALLWFGWFGFNAGSALSSGGLAAMAFAATNTAAAAAALAWAAVERVHRGKASALGIVTGAVAGLVAITPAAGFVTVPAALAIGALVSPICYLGVNYLKPRLGFDDSLDVFGVHGLGGAWGAVATGLFASTAVNPAGADGLFYGGSALVGRQLIAVAACAATAAVGTFVILKLVSLVKPLRVSDEDEAKGLDVAIHGETAYAFVLPEVDGPAVDGALSGLAIPEGPAILTKESLAKA